MLTRNRHWDFRAAPKGSVSQPSSLSFLPWLARRLRMTFVRPGSWLSEAVEHDSWDDVLQDGLAATGIGVAAAYQARTRHQRRGRPGDLALYDHSNEGK